MKFRKATKKEPIRRLSEKEAEKMWDEVQKSLEEEYAGAPNLTPEEIEEMDRQERATMHILPEESEQTEEDIEYLRQNVHRIFKRKV